jgi:hypothetical protein
MQQEITLSQLDQLTSNFQSNNATLPFSTNSAAVTLAALEDYIAEVKSKYNNVADGFRFYFVRYKMNSLAPHIVKDGNKDLSQPSLVVVPIKILDLSVWKTHDLAFDTDKILSLCFCTPEVDNKETGLCPPNCPGGVGDHG